MYCCKPDLRTRTHTHSAHQTLTYGCRRVLWRQARSPKTSLAATKPVPAVPPPAVGVHRYVVSRYLRSQKTRRFEVAVQLPGWRGRLPSIPSIPSIPPPLSTAGANGDSRDSCACCRCGWLERGRAPAPVGTTRRSPARMDGGPERLEGGGGGAQVRRGHFCKRKCGGWGQRRRGMPQQVRPQGDGTYAICAIELHSSIGNA